MTAPNKFYRLETTSLMNAGVAVYVATFSLVSETKKGYWIKSDWLDPDLHWVSKTSVKRYAYPTEQEAAYAFCCRKRRQINIMEHQLKNVKSALAQASAGYFGQQTVTLQKNPISL